MLDWQQWEHTMPGARAWGLQRAELCVTDSESVCQERWGARSAGHSAVHGALGPGHHPRQMASVWGFLLFPELDLLEYLSGFDQ